MVFSAQDLDEHTWLLNVRSAIERTEKVLESVDLVSLVAVQK